VFEGGHSHFSVTPPDVVARPGSMSNGGNVICEPDSARIAARGAIVLSIRASEGYNQNAVRLD
jgi:hypothetical protein